MSAILIENQIVHYEVLGRGKPILFLHGWVGSWRYWIPCMQAASAQFRTYAIDLWGFGDSAKQPALYALERQVELLDHFLDQMGIGKIAIVGHGLGAVVGSVFALRNPRSVDRVLAITYPMDESSVNNRLRTAPPAELAEWLLGKTPFTEAARADAPKADPRALTASFGGLKEANLVNLTAQLSTACLLVHGSADPAIQPPRLEALASLPMQTHAILFEGAGHFPMLDDGSKFHRLLADFLALPGGISPRELQLKEEWKRRVR